ncbi:MAG: DUF423 domain-containing protein [Vicingaceae bacterium]
MRIRNFFIAGGLFAGLAVVLGAMAAHALKGSLSNELLSSFKTGVRFQMYHGLALLALAPSLQFFSPKGVVWTFYTMTIGTFLFSFSIYGLCLLPLIDINASWLGPITPMGGTALIASWVILLFSLKKV